MVHACGYSFMTISGDKDSATRSDHYYNRFHLPPLLHSYILHCHLIASNIPEEAFREEERIAVDR